jgi:hypothetical protein
MDNNTNNLSSIHLHDIAYDVAKNALINWQKKYKKKKTYNHFDVLFPKERQIHSVIQSGLTSFGTTFWENLANRVAEENFYEVRGKRDFNNNVPDIPKQLKEFQQEMRRDVESNKKKLKEAINDIRDFIKSSNFSSNMRTKVEPGKGIDFWYKKNNIELIGDIKSPQENIGNAKKLLEHILIWSTYRLLDEPELEIEAVIVFPYNPYENIEIYNKYQGIKLSPLIHDHDVLLADQFWNRLSGVDESTKIIFDALKTLSTSDEIKNLTKLFYN